MHHRKFYALVNIGVDNWPTPEGGHSMTVETLVDLIKLSTGHSTPVTVRRGFFLKLFSEIFDLLPAKIKTFIPECVTVYMPKSINFESMSQEEFGEFYPKAIDIIAKGIGVDAETLERESDMA